MTPSLVKSSFMTRSNACGFPETGKTNSCCFNHVSFEKTSTILLCKLHFTRVENYGKHTSHFYLEMTCVNYRLISFSHLNCIFI